MAKTAPFDKHSDQYDRWFEVHRQAYDAELETIRQQMPPSFETSIEVGVGSGKFAAPLGIPFGIEPSRAMAAKARQRGIRMVFGVAESLPLSGDAFDLVLLVTTICFVDNLRATFQEACRVMRSGGCILVGFVDKESELGQQYLRNRATSDFYKEATFFSTREVCDHLLKTGFSRLTIKQTLIPGESEGTIEHGYGRGAFIVVKGLKE